MNRFEGVDFARLAVRRLEPDSPPSPEGFRPLRAEFSTFWKKGRVFRELRSRLAGCWYLECDGKLVAYITLLADRLTAELPLLESEGVRYRTFPAVKIGLLAADQRAKGAGTALMRWAFLYTITELCPRLGIRFLTVDALHDPDDGYDVAPYYERFGFLHAAADALPKPGEHYRTMFFDLKPLLDAAGIKGSPTE